VTVPAGASGPSRTTRLSRTEIVDAALEVAAAKGIDGVTMRSVGEALGVTAMALYNHVRHKDDLVDIIVRRVRSIIEPLVLGDDGWEAGLRRHMLSELREQAKYPGFSAVLISRPLMGAGADSVREGTKFFIDAGFDENEARLAWAFASTYLHGRLSVEAHLRAVDPGAHRSPDVKSRNYVEYGVEAVIAGIASMREQRPEKPRAQGGRAQRRSRAPR
jgi:AcrR family transcriptional regulator